MNPDPILYEYRCRLWESQQAYIQMDQTIRDETLYFQWHCGAIAYCNKEWKVTYSQVLICIPKVVSSHATPTKPGY